MFESTYSHVNTTRFSGRFLWKRCSATHCHFCHRLDAVITVLDLLILALVGFGVCGKVGGCSA